MPGNQLAHSLTGHIKQEKQKKWMQQGSVVDSQPSNSRGEEEHAGEVANVSLRPCKAGLGEIPYVNRGPLAL